MHSIKGIVAFFFISFLSIQTGFAESVSFQNKAFEFAPQAIKKKAVFEIVADHYQIITRPPFVSLSAGMGHTCGIGNDQSVWCWGSNDHGQLGIGDNQDRTRPRKVPGLEKATVVAAGGRHTCALAEGKVYCWGWNGDGQIGDGTNDDRIEPVLVAGLTGMTKLSAGGYHSCAMNGLGNLLCWGRNQHHQLGLGAGTTGDEETPEGVASNKADVFAGNNHTCALTGLNGHVSCWGDNFQGKSGIGNENSLPSTVNSPTEVGGLLYVTKVSSGGNHTCALKANKTVSCWGDNYEGQLGNNQSGENHVAAVNVSGLDNVKDIAVSRGNLNNFGNDYGKSYSCALKENGEVYCWGDEDTWGIGFGDQDEWSAKAMEETGSANWNPTVPMRVFVEDAVQLAAGTNHTCALIEDGSFVCWGTNLQGELGDGTNVSKSCLY